MKVRKRHIIYFFLALLDVALIYACYRASVWAYFDVLAPQGGALPLWEQAGQTFVFLYSCCIVGFYAIWSVYGRIYLGLIRQMVKRVLAVNTVGIILFILLLYVLHEANVSRATLGLFYVVSTVAVLFKEWITVQIFYRYRKGRKVQVPVIVIGNGGLAQQYAQAIGTEQYRVEHVIGYISPKEDEVSEDMPDALPYLRKHLGGINDLDTVLSNNEVEAIVIALEADKYECIGKVTTAADKYGKRLTLVPFYNDILPRLPEIDSVHGVSLVNLRSIPLDNPFAAVTKRTLDIVVGLIIILITSWLMLIAAIGTKLSSPGPIFFKQIRTGRNGRTFAMLKFRSMRVAEGAVSTFSEDKNARKTKFGSFIRKYSIDELPQFFNVVKGEMSIIGPRPVVLEETEAYRDRIPLYMLRHQIRPGVSGWAQIHGYRGGTKIEDIVKRTELDLWYAQHWTIMLDIRIFFRTLFGGFIASGDS